MHLTRKWSSKTATDMNSSGDEPADVRLGELGSGKIHPQVLGQNLRRANRRNGRILGARKVCAYDYGSDGGSRTLRKEIYVRLIEDNDSR